MSPTAMKPPAMWHIALKEVQVACRRWRLKLNRNYEWIRIREVEKGQTLRTFALTGLRWSSADDIRQARDLCLRAEALGYWPEAPEAECPSSAWARIAKTVMEDIEVRMPKRGSNRPYLCHLKNEISKLTDPVEPESLLKWISQYDPLEDYYPFLRRLETISQINRALPDLGLEPLLIKLRGRRRQRVSGSAAQLLKANRRRVRFIPETDILEGWLLSMHQRYRGFPFNQYLFALIATYGLRPHEVWHVASIDDRGWATIPGGVIPDAKGRALHTKTGLHVMPPSPASWVELFNLREGFARFQELLHKRYPVDWRPALTKRGAAKQPESPAFIPANNTELGGYVNKLLVRGLAPQLYSSPEDGSERKPLLPYDLRHAYAVRLLSDPMYALVPLEQHAAWMGHDLAVHTQHYHRWIGSEQLARAQQQIVDQCNLRQGGAPVVVDAGRHVPRVRLNPAEPDPELLHQQAEIQRLRAELEAKTAELESRNTLVAQIQAMMTAIPA